MAEYTTTEIREMFAGLTPIPGWSRYCALAMLVFCLAANNPVGVHVLGQVWPVLVVASLLLSLYVSYMAWERILPLRHLYPGILRTKMAIGLCLIPVFGVLWALRTWFCLGRYLSLSKSVVEEDRTPEYHNTGLLLLGVLAGAVFAAAYLCAMEFANEFALYWHLAYVVLAYCLSKAAYAKWEFFFPTYLLPFTVLADFSCPHDEYLMPIARFYCLLVMTALFVEFVNDVIAKAAASAAVPVVVPA